MNKFLLAVILGYFAAFLSFLPVLAFSGRISALGRRANGSLVGFTGGLLIAFICFELLPEASGASSIPVVVIAMLCGILFCAMFENKAGAVAEALHFNKGSKYIRTAVFVSIGVCMHNIPEGMAIGSLAASSPESALKIAVILCLHHLPESAAVIVPFSKGGLSRGRLFICALVLAVPTAAGAALGYGSALFAASSSVFLGFSAGTMIYICCGEIIPESKSLWSGRMSTIAACIGFLAGVVITSLI